MQLMSKKSLLDAEKTPIKLLDNQVAINISSSDDDFD